MQYVIRTLHVCHAWNMIRQDKARQTMSVASEKGNPASTPDSSWLWGLGEGWGVFYSMAVFLKSRQD